MNKTGLLKVLQHQLDELQTLLVKFDQNRPIHTIDVDIFMSKIRNLYEETGLLFNIDSKSGLIEFTPKYINSGEHIITITVEDFNGNKVTEIFTLIIEDFGSKPV
ncbi:MAG: hypothetical protein HOD37_11565, partial [Bacteroidetes bacterium]|nr:hypothetical protein [Bacteroidota bacterium]